LYFEIRLQKYWMHHWGAFDSISSITGLFQKVFNPVGESIRDGKIESVDSTRSRIEWPYDEIAPWKDEGET
jgi:hypothetical protein